MKVKLVLTENICKAEPLTEDIKSLCTNTRVSREYKNGRAEIENKEEPLYVPVKGTGNGLVYAGLFPRIRDLLDKKGIEYTVEDQRPELPEVDYSRIKGKLLPGQAETVAAVVSHYKGIVKLPTASGKTQLIAYLTELYRGISKVLIVSSDSSVLRGINDRIKDVGEGKGYILNKDTDFNPKVDYIVASSRSLHKLEGNWPDIIFYDEVHGAGSPDTSHQLSCFKDCRMFGFSATPSGRSDGSELVIEALFGPIIVNNSYTQARKSGVVCPIRVYMVPVMGGFGNASSKKMDVARDRNGIWRNNIRQNILAEIAREIPEDEKVVIMTVTAEHVFRIHKLLPEFQVAHSGLTDTRFNQFVKWGLVDKNDKAAKNPNVSEIEKEFRNGGIKKVICTGVWKQGVDFPDLGFMIRADGKRGAITSIQIGGRLSRTDGGRKKLGVLIDFYDMEDIFEGRSKDRIRHYKKEGWEIVHGRPDFNKILTEMY